MLLTVLASSLQQNGFVFDLFHDVF